MSCERTKRDNQEKRVIADQVVVVVVRIFEKNASLLLEEVAVDVVVTVTEEGMVHRVVHVADPTIRVPGSKGRVSDPRTSAGRTARQGDGVQRRGSRVR